MVENSKNMLSPIVLFVYNRPDHTRKTIESLQKNMYAKESVLYIFSDSPKKKEDADGVQKVRSFIRTIEGFRKVTIIQRKKKFWTSKIYNIWCQSNNRTPWKSDCP
jgi:GT2 family glycosyltransferase